MIKTHLVFVFIVILQSSVSERRIKNGVEVTADKKYTVYLLKDPNAPVQYLGWTCGGAIISNIFVVTAAACVDDLQRMYVIAGYRKFVTSLQIEKDKCTKRMKKRVVSVCLPKDYKLEYTRTESWTRVDIAVLRIESPFNFADKSFEKYCSYIPTPIKINYGQHLQLAGTDVLALGWGHSRYYEEDLSNTSYNMNTLHYAPTKILDKKKCLDYYSMNKEMWPIIENYMVCTLDFGNLDDDGNVIKEGKPGSGCLVTRTCAAETKAKLQKKLNRKKEFKKNHSIIELIAAIRNGSKTKDVEKYDGKVNKDQIRAFRAPGICQNDHGGPLVTWEGAHEVLIGVATLFKVDEDQTEQKSVCTGPYLFTSTACTGAFLHCILSFTSDDDIDTQRCKQSNGKTFNLEQQHISWNDLPPDK